ncbi:MAG TPA: right-handed parallel beta-helix repeat-containing protein [Propionibacteriaceae bacterium]
MTHVLLTRTIRRIGLAALPVALLAGGLAGTAEAAGPTVACGAVLNQNAVLTKDLYCPNKGVTLAAGVTLDLGGFKLQGNGQGAAVSIPVGNDNAVVNGRIRDWAQSIAFVGNVEALPEAQLALRKLAISQAPVSAEQADVTIEDSNLIQAPLRFSVTGAKVTRSKLTVAGPATVLNGEMNVLSIEDSEVFGQVNHDENQSVRVYNSTLDGKNTTGAALWCSGSTVEIGYSTVKHYATPTDATGCPLHVYNSTFRDSPNGALVVAGTEDTLARISGSTFRTSGVAVRGIGANITGSTFERNTVGVSLDGSFLDSRVTRNTFTANTGNGVELTAGSIRVGTNTAVGNGGYGLLVPGAFDLGGNVARNNAKGNCVGVVCAAQ